MPTQPAVLGTARLNNFRLNYLTAQQADERPARVWIVIGGIDVTKPTAPMRALYKSLTIRDVLFDAPNTCALTLYGAAPLVGQPIEVWLNANAPQLLFNGELQTVGRTYKGRPATVLHPVTAIDDTARANRRRPLRPYVNVSASTIAADLIASFAPGFSSAGVEAGLPAVSINFDGSEGGMKGCLTALAKLVGGYWYFENKTLYFFVTPPGTPPDPIDATPGRFLHDPAITWSIDKSQVRTRCYGKGASTRITATIAAATDLVPLENVEMFNPGGGQAIAGITPDGAASRVLTYTGVQFGGGGGLVGPGAAPSAGPGLTLIAGTGMENGIRRYAITFTTAAGESLPGPVATITAGPLAPPATAVIPGAVTSGGAVDAGSHQYGVTFVTGAGGETLGAPASAPVTTFTDITGASGEIAAPNVPGVHPVATGGGAMASATYWYRIDYVTASGTTGWGGEFNRVPANLTTGGTACQLYAIPTGPAGVTARRIYRTVANSVEYGTANAYKLLTTIANNVDTTYLDTKADSGLGGSSIPTVNTTAQAGTTTHYKTVPLSGLPIGPPVVTARRIYRSDDGAAYKLVTTIANNTQTTYTDTLATASLGAVAPTVNTATANRVDVVVPFGGASVTGRKIYRSAANATPLQLLGSIANNTAPNLTDSFSDSVLTVAPPVTDTSGLVQPSGQVPAGATSLIVANPEPFATGGGWAVVGNGEQVIRYTGKSGTALTGIPATGPGAIVASISYNSTVTSAPALVGVTGILEAITRNAPIHVWVQRDDLAAQAYMVALDGQGDGVYEHIWSDERRTEASLRQVCDAQLKLYSRPMVTVVYASRDPKTKSGKTVQISLTSPAIAETLTIQDVAITELGIRGLVPKFTVTASNVSQSFEAILQMLIRKADA